MHRNEDHATKTIAVSPGAEVTCELPSAGVLRFERNGNAMSGQPMISAEDGKVALRYADGSSVTIKA